VVPWDTRLHGTAPFPRDCHKKGMNNHGFVIFSTNGAERWPLIQAKARPSRPQSRNALTIEEEIKN
jgi:hypothetical protein